MCCYSNEYIEKLVLLQIGRNVRNIDPFQRSYNPLAAVIPLTLIARDANIVYLVRYSVQAGFDGIATTGNRLLKFFSFVTDSAAVIRYVGIGISGNQYTSVGDGGNKNDLNIQQPVDYVLMDNLVMSANSGCDNVNLLLTGWKIQLK